MKKVISLFFCLFFMILIFGCVQPTGKEENVTYVPTVMVGNLSVNKPITGKQLSMHGGEQVEVGFNFENKGEYTAKNVVSTLYGCNMNIRPNITIPASGEKQKDVFAGTSDYVSWQVIAPQVPPGTATKCDLTARVCFDYATVASTEIDFIPNDYIGGPLEHPTTVSSGPFEIEFDFATPVRMWNKTVPVSIAVLYRNIGNGEVAYTGNAAKKGHLDRITLELDDAIFKIKNAREWERISFPKDVNIEEQFPGKYVTSSTGGCQYACVVKKENPPQGKCERISPSTSFTCENITKQGMCDSFLACVWVSGEETCSERNSNECESDNHCILETVTCNDRIEVNDTINIPNQLFFVETNDNNKLGFILDYDELNNISVGTKANYFLPSLFSMKLGYDIKTRKYTTLNKRINLLVDNSTIDKLVSKGITTKIHYRYCVTTDTLKLTITD